MTQNAPAPLIAAKTPADLKALWTLARPTTSMVNIPSPRFCRRLSIFPYNHDLSRPGWTSQVEFYGHTKGHCRAFSNFYVQPRHTTFIVPDSCWTEELALSGLPREVDVLFSEKSIMLCKAAVMRDSAAYAAIAESTCAKDAKA